MTTTATTNPHDKKQHRGVPITVLRDHITNLLAEVPTATFNDIATAASVDPKTIRNIMGHQQRTVYRTTSHRIINLTAYDLGKHGNPNDAIYQCRSTIDELTGNGWPIETIARAAHLHPAVLHPDNLNNITLNTAARIMHAYRHLHNHQPDNHQPHNPTIHVRRMLEALNVMGWPTSHLARLVGVPESTLTHGPIDTNLERAMVRLFKGLRFRIGPDPEEMNRAKAAGYVPWAAWDDHTISDPAAQPNPSWVTDTQWRDAITARFTPTT